MEAKISQNVHVLSSSASEETVLKSLHDLNIFVDSNTINGEKLLDLIPPVVLFRRLALNNSSEIKSCTALLKKLLNFLKPEAIIQQYEDAAVQGVNHPSVEVRELCLSQVERCVQTFHGVIVVVRNVDLLNFVIRNLGHSHMGCAKRSSTILINVSKHSDGLKVLLDEGHQVEFEELMKKSDTVRFRVYELFVKITECNHDVFAKVKSLFTRLAAEIDNNDVLIQMNCIETLTDLFNINEDAFYLPEDTGVNLKLYGILKSNEFNPLASLLLPAIVKYFGHLSIKKPQFVFSHYPDFFEFTFECIQSSDGNLFAVAIDTIGAIGLSNEGLGVLFQTESCKNIMVIIGNHLQNAEEQIKVHCLDCLAFLFTSDESSDKNTLELIHQLYQKLAPSPLHLLFEMLKQPFNSVRKSAFRTLHSLVSYQWMLADINNIPGFFEYLLDRRTENEKECRELKYEVIKKMSFSAAMIAVFDKPTILKVKQFVRDGPFYAGSDVSVSVDEN